MIRRQPTWFLLALTSLVAGLDQFTKYVIVSNLDLHEAWMPLDWLAPIVTIRHVHNTGAAFGIFPAGSIVFTIVGVIVVAAIIYYYHTLPDGQWWVRTALGLQLGGAVGNLTDRFLKGHVTDFINFTFWPVFNLADSAIVVGVLILVAVLIVEERREARERAETDGRMPGVESDMMSGDGTAL